MGKFKNHVNLPDWRIQIEVHLNRGAIEALFNSHLKDKRKEAIA
jgi:hypothetical protein